MENTQKYEEGDYDERDVNKSIHCIIFFGH